MLKSVFMALANHLAPLGIPCYLADCVPEGAQLPYCTASVRLPLHPGDSGQLLLTCWCAGDMPHIQRLTHTEQLLKLLPARGLRLEADAGVLILEPESGVSCLREAGVHGMQTGWKLQFFPHA